MAIGFVDDAIALTVVVIVVVENEDANPARCCRRRRLLKHTENNDFEVLVAGVPNAKHVLRVRFLHCMNDKRWFHAGARAKSGEHI